MSKYLQLLQKKILNDSKLLETDFKFHLLSGPQRWLVIKEKANEIISNLAENADIPFVGIQKRNNLYILDLTDKYQDIITDVRIKDYERHLNFCRIPNSTDKLYFTYPLAGRISLAFGDVLVTNGNRLIETCEYFKLDFAIWVTKLEPLGNEFYIRYIIEPRKFVFKEHFFTHIIPPEHKGLTVSFVAEYVKIADLLLEKFEYAASLNFIFTDKLLFADAFEMYVFKETIESTTGVKYDPLLGVRDYKLRIKNMLETLKNIKKQ